MKSSSQIIMSIGVAGLCWLSACQDKAERNEHRVNNLIISARQLPSQGNTEKSRGKHTLTVLLSVQPEKNGTDLMKQGVTKPEEYAQRVETLSFRAADYISFRIGEHSLPPTLARYENIHDPSGKVDFIIKLVLEETAWQEMMTDTSRADLVLEDPYWGTGVHHFTFNSQQFARSI